MPEELKNYKCPACTAPLRYDSASGKLKCDYCGGVYEISALESAAELETEEDKVEGWALDEERAAWGSEADDLRAFSCPSCGAELICDDTAAAMSCPYCDNNAIVPSSLSGSFKPDLVIPFKYDKEQAKDAFRAHLKGKKLLPRLFSQENHLDEIKGVYVPFWLFDADADATLKYSATQTRAWADSEFDYIETSFYELTRAGDVRFKAVPVDGSEKMDDTLMESVEPFDVSKAVNFEAGYLAGYYADKYDVPSKSCVGRANLRMQQSVKDIFISTTAGYQNVIPRASRIRVTNGRAKYALLPVWILNTTWHGTKYVFAMNGQTGKFVGNLPCDNGLRLKWHLIYSGIFAAALLGIEWLLHIM